jgi:hypothetical protein
MDRAARRVQRRRIVEQKQTGHRHLRLLLYERPHELVQGSFDDDRIGVEKEEDLAGSGFGAEIRSRRVAQVAARLEDTDEVAFARFLDLRAAPAVVDDDRLERRAAVALRSKRVETPRERGAAVEGDDDDGNVQAAKAKRLLRRAKRA